MSVEFTPWPKIARLNRDIVITEKIDGTNAAVGIVDVTWDEASTTTQGKPVYDAQGMSRIVYAQSRKNLITPDKDNFGFARWVYDNAEALAKTLGPGLHFGEWWGSGIQRGYGLPKGEKRFSLFNTARWANEFGRCGSGLCVVPGLYVVPVLYEGPFGHTPIAMAQSQLRIHGSHAAPGFMRPEGIVLYHTAANEMFKVTLEGDAEPKSLKVAT